MEWAKLQNEPIARKWYVHNLVSKLGQYSYCGFPLKKQQQANKKGSITQVGLRPWLWVTMSHSWALSMFWLCSVFGLAVMHCLFQPQISFHDYFSLFWMLSEVWPFSQKTECMHTCERLPALARSIIVHRRVCVCVLCYYNLDLGMLRMIFS